MLIMISNKIGHLAAAAFIMSAFLAFTGCGEEKEPVGIVTGTIKSGDKLIGDCKVAIYNTQSMGSISATVDETGAFEVKDVPIGNYEVKVYPTPSYGNEEKPDPRIPKKFRDYKTSGVTLSIDGTDAKTLDINFK